MSTSHQIAFVRSGSPAALAGVEPMDIIKEINGVELIDIFDYYYYVISKPGIAIDKADIL